MTSLNSSNSLNTSSPSLNIKPMLAIEMEPKLVKFPAFVQPKLDGIRCLIYKERDQIIFQSRQNKLFEPFIHLLPDLEKIFEKDPPLILDGELYCHGLGFEAVTSMVRRAKVRHPDVEKINYVIYDCISKETYKHRMSKLNMFILNHVFFIETIEVTKMQEIEDSHSHYTDYGYEGIMIRADGPYKHGRSKDLLKYKKFKDTEYLVVGHT
jgi:ATP-dependent DNA ligase